MFKTVALLACLLAVAFGAYFIDKKARRLRILCQLADVCADQKIASFAQI